MGATSSDSIVLQPPASAMASIALRKGALDIGRNEGSWVELGWTVCTAVDSTIGLCHRSRVQVSRQNSILIL